MLPSKAYAKISMRLVPNQDYRKIAKLFQKHFESIAPAWVKVKVDELHGGQAYVSPIDTIGYQAASKAIETVLGKNPSRYAAVEASRSFLHSKISLG